MQPFTGGIRMYSRWFLSRIKKEKKIMLEELPQFKLFEFGDKIYFKGRHRTTTKRLEFQLKLSLPKEYPDLAPALYIINPLTLRKFGGGTINSIGSSHSFHTLRNGPSGCIQICHAGNGNWDASKTCIGVLFKGIIWCEAYAVHLRTGIDISEIIENWGRRRSSWKKKEIELNELLPTWPGEKTLETSWDTTAELKLFDLTPGLTLTTSPRLRLKTISSILSDL
jgi:hypothetical protein